MFNIQFCSFLSYLTFILLYFICCHIDCFGTSRGTEIFMSKIKSSLFNFFLKLKHKIFKMMPCQCRKFIHSFIHSFIFYLKVIVTSILHRLFLLAPTLPLNYPYIVTFHLVSGDLQGGNNRNKLLKMQCSIYSFIRPF